MRSPRRVAEDPRPESAAERAFKRRFGGKDKGRDKREDYALDLFREAIGCLDDVERVNGLLRELGKLYNPVTDAPIVDLETRREVMALLRAGSRGEAEQLLDRRRQLYAPVERAEDSRIRSQEQWDTK
jgi:hypothetical protein